MGGRDVTYQVIIGDTVDDTEIREVIDTRRIVAMPCHHIVRRVSLSIMPGMAHEPREVSGTSGPPLRAYLGDLKEFAHKLGDRLEGYRRGIRCGGRHKGRRGVLEVPGVGQPIGP